MASSARMLRDASDIVRKHLKIGPYYVDACMRPLTSNDWYVDPESVVKICRDDANKLLEHATAAQESAQALMNRIEHSVQGFFVQKVYQSPNWAHAHALLKEFSINVAGPQAQLARRRLEELDRYKPTSPELDGAPIVAEEGDFHPDIERALERLRLAYSGYLPESLSEKQQNYSMLLLIYSACFAVKSWLDVNIHSAAWNSFKKGLEGHFMEKGEMPPGESTVSEQPNGSTVFAHYTPKCWDDMNEFEQSFESLSSRKRTAELFASAAATSHLHELLLAAPSTDTFDDLLWLLQFCRNKILPKVLYAFGDEI